MSTPLAQRLWPACLSALQLDRFRMGELSGAAAEEVRAHVAGCTRCAEAIRELSVDEALPPMRVVPLQPRRSSLWPRRAAAAGLGVAAAASLLLVLRPGAGVRTKGTAPALSMYVQHGGEVRRAGPGETVAPGDALRFAVTTPVAAYVAVLSIDPLGHGSVYFPLGARAQLLPAGQEVPLPIGTRLDATVGEERIVGIFCSAPVELEPVRAALESGRGTLPDGCQETRWSFVKR
jgi:hypothetical protein